MPRLYLVLQKGTELTFVDDSIQLKLPEKVGVLIQAKDLIGVVKRPEMPENFVLTLPEGYDINPPYDGKDLEISKFLSETYISFGIPGRRETVFFIPRCYIADIKY